MSAQEYLFTLEIEGLSVERGCHVCVSEDLFDSYPFVREFVLGKFNVGKCYEMKGVNAKYRTIY